MPGLLGTVRQAPDPQLATRFERGLRRMQRHRPLLVETVRDPADVWATGRAHLGILQRAAQGRTGDVVVWVHGDVSSREPLPEPLTATEMVRQLYHRYGSAFPGHLRGAFAVVVLDPPRRRLTIANDLVGTYPLYWLNSNSEFAFSSDLGALLELSGGHRSLDMRAVSDYLTLGFVVGEKTLVEGIHALNAGEALVFEWDSRRLQSTCHSPLDALFRPVKWTQVDYVNAVGEAFAKSVSRCFDGNHRYALSLSGGLDSRAILSAVNGAIPHLTTYTLGVRGCADELIADRLATIAGSAHTFFELNDGYLRDFLANLTTMVSLTDGLYISHGMTEMLAVQFVERTGATVLLRGHGGEVAKASLAWPLHTDEFTHTAKNLDELVEYLAKRVNGVTPRLPLNNLLTSESAARGGRGSRDSLARALGATRLGPADACSYLYLREHFRRYTVPSLELFRSTIEVRLPFLDHEFLEVLLSGPAQWRDRTDIHRAVIRSGNPAMLRVRNSNTGAPAGANPRIERAAGKLATLLRRANVHGFRHYHNFDGWMRKILLDTVETELLGPTARIQSFVDRAMLRQVISETRRGVTDHAYLLQALLILELWQRENGIEARW